MDLTLGQKVAEQFNMVWKFFKEEFVRILVTLIIEGSFFSLSTYFKTEDMHVLFYISVSITVISGIFLLIYWFIVFSGKARKEFEKDMSDLMKINSTVQQLRMRQIFYEMWRPAEGVSEEDIWMRFIEPRLSQEKDEVFGLMSKKIDSNKRLNRLLDLYYESDSDKRDISN